MVVFGQKWTCLAKSVVFEQKCLYSANWLYLGKVVVFGPSGCFRAKVAVLTQSSCILVVIVKSGCIRANMVVFGQKWL